LITDHIHDASNVMKLATKLKTVYVDMAIVEREHNSQDCLKLIESWEARDRRQCGAILVNYELRALRFHVVEIMGTRSQVKGIPKGCY
jgi:hypothetical protein